MLALLNELAVFWSVNANEVVVERFAVLVD